MNKTNGSKGAVSAKKVVDMPPCYCCKKVWRSNESGKFAQAEGKVVCLSHHGVSEWSKNAAGGAPAGSG